MSIKTLFSIILKVLGIFFIKDILASIPQVLSVFLYISDSDTITEAAWTLFASTTILGIYVLVSYVLIFKTDWVMNFLKLEQGFDEPTLPLNMHRSVILSICVIVIGGLVIADAIPSILGGLYSYYNERRLTRGTTDPDITYTVLAGFRLLVGLLMVGNQRQIVNFIERKRRV